MSTFYRQDLVTRSAQGEAIAGVEVYVCNQPLTTPLNQIPPAPLATLYAASSSNAATITTAAQAGVTINFTFSTTPPADVVPGAFINVSGVTPSAYNGVWQVLSVVGNVVSVVTPYSTFAPTVPVYVSGGSVATSALPNPFLTDGNGNGFFYTLTGIVSVVYFDPLNRIVTQTFADQAVLAPGGGSVTSIALVLPPEFTVTGSPVTSNGTITATKAVENANTVWAGPTGGSPAAPAFRALVAADLAGISGIGTVTSVAATLSGGALFTAGVTGSPIISSGTLAFTFAFANQAANLVIASPASGGSGAVVARALVAADLCGVLPVSFSATPVFNAGSFALPTFTITLTGNVTSSTVSNPVAGQTITFIITQDGTGSRTFTWPANFKGASTIAPDANNISVQSFVYDGANFRAIGAGSTTGS